MILTIIWRPKSNLGHIIIIISVFKLATLFAGPFVTPQTVVDSLEQKI
jgi:hypothetical protein